MIDHHDGLLGAGRARELTGVVVVPNAEARGLSGARNTGIATATGAIVAFLDDDADRRAGLDRPPARSRTPTRTSSRSAGAWCRAGTTRRPAWLPEEFDWVVGCTYAATAPTRDPSGTSSGRTCPSAAPWSTRSAASATPSGAPPISRPAARRPSCSSGRRSTSRAASSGTSRRRWSCTGCPAARATRRYFRARCYAEGISKTYVSRLVGSRDGLASERAYTTRALPRAFVRELRGAVRTRDRAGLARAATLVAGVATTGAGYAGTRMPRRTRTATPPEPAFVPARVFEIDLTEEIVDLTAVDPARNVTYGRALVLARRAGAPVGILDLTLDAGGLAAADLSTALEDAFGATPITGPRRRAATRATAQVTVVIATRDRVETLERCLASLRALDPAPVRVVVVDNCPSNDDAAELVRAPGRRPDPQLRYVREDRPGLARAHNRGPGRGGHRAWWRSPTTTSWWTASGWAASPTRSPATRTSAASPA